MLAEIITNDRDLADVMYLIGLVLAALAGIAHLISDKWRDASKAPIPLLAFAIAFAELGLLAG